MRKFKHKTLSHTAIEDLFGRYTVVTDFKTYTDIGGWMIGSDWIEQVERKAILTSEDGPELFEDDKAFCINKDSKKCKIWPITIQDYDPASHFIYFSTREAAEDYRLNNARVLSIEDIRGTFSIIDHPAVRPIIENIVKSRLS